MNKNNQCTGVVYLQRNLINGKCYIGQTSKSNPQSRWYQDGSGYIHQKKFWNAISKYGWGNFEHIILESDIPVSQLGEREDYWIRYYDSIEQGYNVASGSNAVPMTQEMRQRISEGWTLDLRQKQSNRMKEKWKNDPVFKEKALASLRSAPRPDFSGNNNPMYGTHRTGKDAARKRRVECIETGDQFDTIKQAAEWLGSVSQKSHISAVCKGIRKSCGQHPITKQPLHWRYIDE